MKRISIACVMAVLACLPARSAFAASCDDLATLALKDTAITKAEVVAAGAFEVPGGGAGRGPNPYAALGEFCLSHGCPWMRVPSSASFGDLVQASQRAGLLTDRV